MTYKLAILSGPFSAAEGGSSYLSLNQEATNQVDFLLMLKVEDVKHVRVMVS